MSNRLIDRLLREAPIIYHISRRDMPKRLAVAGLIAVGISHVGTLRAALIFAACICAWEALFAIVMLAGGRGRPHAFRRPVALMLTLIRSGETLTFCVPALLFAGSGSLPVLLAGMVWIFALFVHTSNTYINLPVHGILQMVPCYGVMFGLIWIACGTVYEVGLQIDWWLLTAYAVVYAANASQTMALQGDTRRALEAARSEAALRLEALERMTRFDPLTDLRNRTAFETDVREMLQHARGQGEIALFVMDLDGFKPINDSYGHDAGDRVLREVAARLRAITRDGGIAARIGGDEFAMAIPGIAGPTVALRIGVRTVRDLERPITGAGPDLRISASVGIALCEPGECDLREWVARADQAMYRAKNSPTSDVELWNPGIAPRLGLEDKRRIEDALRRGEIRPYYQPKVALGSGRIVGFEALSRWVRPDGTVHLPSEFMPQIDELGLHKELLHTITRQVLADLPRLRVAGLGTARIALNLPESALATRSGLAAFLACFEGREADLSQLTLEITEDVLISRAGSVLQESISLLRMRGTRISLDDFGTGYASFRHLRQLEFDELKIDRSFVAGLCEDDAAAVIVEGFLSIARGLGVSVVAEGVESAAQEARLRALGCPEAQGFRYGAAMPLAETEVRLMSLPGPADRRTEVRPPGSGAPRAAPGA